MRPTTPTPLTLEEHREMGCEMRRVQARMRELCGVVNEVYGPQNLAAFSFVKAAEAVDRLCRELQAQARRDLPGYQIDGFYE